MLTKPDKYSEEDWEEILRQADEWGRMFMLGYPGTSFDFENKVWDFSNNETAIQHYPAIKEKKIPTIMFAYLYKDRR